MYCVVRDCPPLIGAVSLKCAASRRFLRDERGAFKRVGKLSRPPRHSVLTSPSISLSVITSVKLSPTYSIGMHSEAALLDHESASDTYQIRCLVF